MKEIQRLGDVGVMVRGGVRGEGRVGTPLGLWSGTKRLQSAIKLVKIYRQACIIIIIIIIDSSYQASLSNAR